LHNTIIPYGKQQIDDEDIYAVIEALRSDWLTTGPRIDAFEQVVAEYVNSDYAVAVSSGTAALHATMHALGIAPGDEVIVPAITFVATANAVVYQGGTPIFVDVCPDTLLIDVDKIEDKITPNTKAIIAVDYAGQPCDYDSLRSLAERYDIHLVSDACHALGAEYKGEKIGSIADLTVFSFHPVKHITTGEGGMVTTNNEKYYQIMRAFRNHGITSDHQERAKKGTWHYEMSSLGYNYRISDIQCALGISQLKKLDRWIDKRRELAQIYNNAFELSEVIETLSVKSNLKHVYHLYVVKLDYKKLNINRNKMFNALKEKGIGVNVHYSPVYLHPFYIEKFKTFKGICPVAEEVFEKILSLPLFPGISTGDLEYVITSLSCVCNE